MKCFEALLASPCLADCGVSTWKVSQSSDGTYDDVVLCVTNLTNGGEILC